jgi:hypothetical protein
MDPINGKHVEIVVDSGQKYVGTYQRRTAEHHYIIGDRGWHCWILSSKVTSIAVQGDEPVG